MFRTKIKYIDKVWIAALFFACNSNSFAQEIASITTPRDEVMVRDTVEFNVQLRQIPHGRQTVCNLHIDFGDGFTDNIRIEAPFGTIWLRHTYTSPGRKIVQANGKIRYQGLNSALGCFGQSSASITVRPINQSAAPVNRQPDAPRAPPVDAGGANKPIPTTPAPQPASETVDNQRDTPAAAPSKASIDPAQRRSGLEQQAPARAQRNPDSPGSPTQELRQGRPEEKKSVAPKARSVLDL